MQAVREPSGVWQGMVTAESDVQDEQGLGVQRACVESNQEEWSALPWAGGGRRTWELEGQQGEPHGPGQAALQGTVSLSWRGLSQARPHSA